MPERGAETPEAGEKTTPWLEFRAGESVFQEGEAATALFIVQEGEIAIIKGTESNAKVVDVLRKGDFFGAASALEEDPRRAGARAQSDCRLLKMDFSAFATVLSERPQVGVRMIQRLSVQLEQLYDKLAGEAETAVAVALGETTPPEVELQGQPYLMHEESGTRFPLHLTDESSVGRSKVGGATQPDIDLRVLDSLSTVSGFHAKICPRGDGFYVLEGTPSTNGTFVDGERVTPGVEVKLVLGSVTRFGGVTTVFRIG